jgi:hypothetical protein
MCFITITGILRRLMPHITLKGHITTMNNIPIGYLAICTHFGLVTLPYYRQSYIALHGRGKTIIENNNEIHIYPKTYALNDALDMLANLEFALKHEGINLAIIKQLFHRLDIKLITEKIQLQPTGIYSRKIWFLYEFLMETTLALPDCKNIKYVDLLDTALYFTANNLKSPRHAINNNLLGNNEFCPFIRRTPMLEEFINKQLNVEAKKMIDKYDASLISRACNYLYTKETMSSFEIERKKPNAGRVARFIKLLQQSSKIKHLSKSTLIELQNIIVDPRFCDKDYRKSQNYIGENIRPGFPKIHYISPKPIDVPHLMQGLLATLERMENSAIHPVVIAASIAFGFVFIHPFEDGNGRIHRFLIHYILAKTDFSPSNVIIPVSAIMLKKMHEYDTILELFSKPLLTTINDFDLAEDGSLTINQPTKLCYQYLDYTSMVEYLFNCIQEAIREQMENEILFLLHYDQTKSAIQDIVDLPDKDIDLLIKLITQNHGTLARKKREDYFSLLTDAEIKALTACVRQNMMGNS